MADAKLHTLFFGTPTVAVPFLELLAKRTDVAAVVSQPDKPAGRALAVAPTPVKARALELGLKVIQPARPAEARAELAALKPDLALVVAYGRILKPDLLAVPRLGMLNVHFSLLPKYRGAAPVQWALARGETRSGVTLFWLDQGMDTGPVQASAALDVGDDDAPALLARLASLGLALLDEALTDIAAGRVRRTPQTGEPSLAPLIKKEDARLSFDLPAKELHDRVRGFRLWPKAHFDGPERLIVLRTRLSEEPGEGPPGRVVRIERGGGILVECSGRSRLWFLEVQPEGKKPISAADFLNGLRLGAGDFLPWR